MRTLILGCAALIIATVYISHINSALTNAALSLVWFILAGICFIAYIKGTQYDTKKEE